MKRVLASGIFLLLSVVAYAAEKNCNSSREIRDHIEIRTRSGLLAKPGQVIADVDSRFCVHKIQNGKTRLKDGTRLDALKIVGPSDFYAKDGLEVAFSDINASDNGLTFSEAKLVCPELTLRGVPKGSWRSIRSRFGKPNEGDWLLSAESLALYFADSDLYDMFLFGRGMFWTGSYQHNGTASWPWVMDLSATPTDRSSVDGTFYMRRTEALYDRKGVICVLAP